MNTGSVSKSLYDQHFNIGMQEDLFTCISCKEPHDLELRIQKVLIPCYHYLCLSCLKNIFANYPAEERQCPTCKVCLSSTITTPEAFATNYTTQAILKRNERKKLGYCEEHDSQRILFCITDQISICKYCYEYGAHKGHNIQLIHVLRDQTSKKRNRLKELLQENAAKKQKGEQAIREKLTQMQDLVTAQFFEMRKMLHMKQAEISEKIDAAVKTENEILMNAYHNNKSTLESKMVEKFEGEYDFFTTEECENYENYFPALEMDNKLEGMLSETHAILNRFLSTIASLQLQPTQTHEVSTQTIEEIPKLMLHQIPPMTLENEAFNGPLQRAFDEMEEEFAEDSKDCENNQPTEMMMEIGAESELKLDYSNQLNLDETLTRIYSEEFWNRTDKNKLCHFEANFSASSLSDKQCLEFIQNILVPMENLNTIVLNFAQTNISSESFQPLTQCLNNYQLKTFVLNCSHTSISYESIKHLDEGLYSSKQTLEKIEIILDFTNVQGEKFLDILMGMPQLRHLTLSFENSQISPEVVSSIVFCLRFLAQNLESLDLNFNGTNIKDEDLNSFSNHAIFYLEKLELFKLSLGQTSISDDLFLEFFESLNLIAPRLLSFELDLHTTALTEAVFQAFCERALSKMVNLEQLKLDLSQTKINHKALESMQLPVRNLKSLTLNFNKTLLSDSSLKIFQENNNFKNIIRTNFSFEEAQISEKALQDFKDYIKKNKSSHLTSNLNKISFKPTLKNRTIPVRDQDSSSQYFSDAENHPISIDDFKQKRHSRTVNRIGTLTKRKILLQIKKAVLIEHDLKSDPSFDISELPKLIQELEIQTYNKILRKVLIRNHPHWQNIGEDLKYYRQCIRRWMESFLQTSSQPNINKDPLKISLIKVNKFSSSQKETEILFSKRWMRIYEEKISFKEKAIEILKSMTTRSLATFYQRILEYAKGLSPKYENWQIPSKPQYNWWYEYMSREREIGDMWTSLPRAHDLPKEEYTEPLMERNN